MLAVSASAARCPQHTLRVAAPEYPLQTAAPCHMQAYPGRHGMGPTHPEHAIGASLHKLQVGQTIDIKGPFGDFSYQPGQYKTVGAPCFDPVHDTAVLVITPTHERVKQGR